MQFLFGILGLFLILTWATFCIQENIIQSNITCEFMSSYSNEFYSVNFLVYFYAGWLPYRTLIARHRPNLFDRFARRISQKKGSHTLSIHMVIKLQIFSFCVFDWKFDRYSISRFSIRPFGIQVITWKYIFICKWFTFIFRQSTRTSTCLSFNIYSLFIIEE